MSRRKIFFGCEGNLTVFPFPKERKCKTGYSLFFGTETDLLQRSQITVFTTFPSIG